jgi:hypothetical protein
MRRRPTEGFLIALVVVGSFAAAGCLKGSSSSNNNSTSQLATARNYFIQSVYPTMAAQCGGCHSGTGGGEVFMASTPGDTYNSLQNTPQLIDTPTNSQLIKHIHANLSVVLSPEMRDLFTQWLTLEANARGITNTGSKPTSLQDAYAQFAKCMTVDWWNVTGMGNLPFVQTDADGPCLGCHSGGQGGAFLNATPAFTFTKMQTFPYIEKLVVGKVDSSGHFDSLIPSRRFIEKANEGCPVGSTFCHPTYGLPPEIEGAVTNFVDTTLQNLTGGTCGLEPPIAAPDAGAVDAGE